MDINDWLNENAFDISQEMSVDDSHKCPDIEASETAMETDDTKADSEDSSDEKDNSNGAVAEENVFNQVTMLVPEEPTTNLLVNTSDKTMRKKMKRSDKTIHEVAPGEAKLPNDWLRQHDFDITAFPELFSNGLYGFNHERKKKLSLKQFMSQRLLNRNPQFAMNEDFVFVAQQMMERDAIERQINVSLQKGKIVEGSDGKLTVDNPANAMSVLANIPGSPLYWKGKRNEIFARLI